MNIIKYILAVIPPNIWDNIYKINLCFGNELFKTIAIETAGLKFPPDIDAANWISTNKVIPIINAAYVLNLNDLLVTFNITKININVPTNSVR